MSEMLDVYDANMSHLGIADRSVIHRLGLWHHGFHCWIVSAQYGGSLLFQFRIVPNRPDGILIASAGGHLQAGEAVDGCLRELAEELGMQVEADKLYLLGTRLEVNDRDQGKVQNREYQSIYFLRDDRPLTAYQPQVEEMSGVYLVPIKALYALFTQQSKRADHIHGIRFNECKKCFLPDERSMTPQSFNQLLPHNRYYGGTLSRRSLSSCNYLTDKLCQSSLIFTILAWLI